jgi:hypothetical protein
LTLRELKRIDYTVKFFIPNHKNREKPQSMEEEMKQKSFLIVAMILLVFAIIVPPRNASAWEAKWTLFLPYNIDENPWWTGVNIQSTENTSNFNIMFYHGATLYATKSDWTLTGGTWSGLVKDLVPSGSTFQTGSMITLESDQPFSVTQFTGNSNKDGNQGFGFQTFYAYLKVNSKAWPYKQDRSKAGTCITALPYTIKSSGLYYLVEDLTSTENGITVNADNVTIDLNGFSLIGPGKSSGTGNGIYIIGKIGVEVKNGTIREFGLNGISEDNNNGTSHCFLNLRLIGNGNSGIEANGNGHLVKDCTASSNGSDGIYVGGGSTVSGSTCYSNGGSGIYANSGNTVTGNTTNNNQIFGIRLSDQNLVDGNTACNNDQFGGGYDNISSCTTCIFGNNVAP